MTLTPLFGFLLATDQTRLSSATDRTGPCMIGQSLRTRTLTQMRPFAHIWSVRSLGRN